MTDLSRFDLSAAPDYDDYVVEIRCDRAGCSWQADLPYPYTLQAAVDAATEHDGSAHAPVTLCPHGLREDERCVSCVLERSPDTPTP